MGKSILITGGNRGIGWSLVRGYLAEESQVTVLCRNSSSLLESSGANVYSGIDLTKYEHIQKAKSSLIGQKYDYLILNAGLLCRETLDELDEAAQDRIRLQFEINALSPLVLTAALQAQVKNGGKVILLTSRMGSIEDNGSGARYGYRMSKAALNAAGKSLSIDLAEREIAVGIFHPGWVQTEMTGNTGNLTADESAALLRERIESLSMDSSGQFIHANGDPLPW